MSQLKIHTTSGGTIGVSGEQADKAFTQLVETPDKPLMLRIDDWRTTVLPHAIEAYSYQGTHDN